MELPAAGPSSSTETPLDLPSFGRMFVLFGRALRLRCPHCGRGAVLQGWGPRSWARARERCSGCNFRFMRSSESYFTGAMFCNLLLAELVFACSFLAAVMLTWPDVPWDALTYGGAAIMVTLPVVSYPVAMVLWLTMDVLVRPVTSAELA